MKLSALVLFAVMLAALAAPPSTTTSQSFSDAELQCFAREMVLYPVDGKCYKLHQRGPCPEHQWLVFTGGEGVAPPTLQCRTPRCNSTLSPIYWPEDGLCHKRSDKPTLCRFTGTELRSDSYGNGECACEKTYARHEPEVLRRRKEGGGEWPWEGDCHPLFHRGPCPAGKIMHPKLLMGFGMVAECFTDLCATENSASAPGSSYAMRQEDNRCYKLGATGPPCAANEVYAVHPVTNLPACYSSVHTVFEGAVRCGGSANIDKNTGECREELVIRAQSFGFQATRRKRNTRKRTRRPNTGV